ncbi:choice-of-anchor A family protein [Plantibacter flavus]|uniref:DUF5979 domain-containing protein n=1 Tax=Plantibacter flavus TaxID=150123 RepID=UPI003F154FDD
MHRGSARPSGVVAVLAAIGIAFASVTPVATAVAAPAAAPRLAAAAPGCPVPGGPGSGEPGGSDANVSVFAGGDYTVGRAAAESEGVLVVGADAVFDRERPGVFNVGVVGVGSQVPPPAGSDMLLAGGSVSVGEETRLDVGHGIGGNIAAGGSITPESRIETSGGMLRPALADPLGPFVDFGATIRTASDGFAALSTTGTVSEAYGTITFTGDGSSAQQVFTISGSRLGTAADTRSIRFAGIPTGATIVVNVTGSSAEFAPAGFFTDTDPRQITFDDPRFVTLASTTMWNFAEATDVLVSTGDQVLGSLLVPRADSSVEIAASTNGRVLIGGDLLFAGDGNEAHAYPYPSPEFECKPTIEPLPLGSLAVTKVVDGTDAGLVDPTRSYVGTYSCAGPAGQAIPGGSWSVRAGETTVVAAHLRIGSVCTLVESAPPPPVPGDDSYVWSPAVITPEQIEITSTTEAALVEVRNTVDRSTAPLTVEKRVSGEDVAEGLVFTGTVRCTVNGADVTPGDGTWTAVADAGPVALGETPIGASCAFTEDPPDAPAPGVGWSAPRISPNPVIVDGTTGAAVVVENVAEPTTASFRLSKTIIGDAGDATGPFSFTASCTLGDATTLPETSVSLAGGASWDAPDVTAGSTCSVTEGADPPGDGPGAWQPPVIAVSGVPGLVSGRTVTFVLPPAGAATVQVSVTDEWVPALGSFAVQKITIDPRRVLSVDRPYVGVWQCDVDGTEIAGGSWEVKANTGPLVLADDLPTTAVCFASESLLVDEPDGVNPLVGWAPVTSDASNRTVAQDEVVVISIVNTVQEFRASPATIRKVLTDPGGLADPATQYSGTVLCEPPGDLSPIEGTWSVTAGAEPVLLIDGLPDQSTCTVTEDTVAPPGADAEWQAPVIAPNSFVARVGQTVEVTVTNLLTPVIPPVVPPVDPPDEGGPAELSRSGTDPSMGLALAGALALLGATLVLTTGSARRHRAGKSVGD